MFVNPTNKTPVASSLATEETPVNNQTSTPNCGRTYSPKPEKKNSVTAFFQKLFSRNKTEDSLNSSQLNGRVKEIPSDEREGGGILFVVLIVLLIVGLVCAAITAIGVGFAYGGH